MIDVNMIDPYADKMPTTFLGNGTIGMLIWIPYIFTIILLIVNIVLLLFKNEKIKKGRLVAIMVGSFIVSYIARDLAPYIHPLALAIDYEITFSYYIPDIVLIACSIIPLIIQIVICVYLIVSTIKKRRENKKCQE